MGVKPAPAGTHPVTSTSTSSDPGAPAKIDTAPVASTPRSTPLGTVSPATKLMVDTTGLVPPGQTVKNPGAPGWVTVTLRATAATCDGVTPSAVVTFTVRVSDAFSAPAPPYTGRVSMTRAGEMGRKPRLSPVAASAMAFGLTL